MPLIRKRRPEPTREPRNEPTSDSEPRHETPRQRRRTDDSPASADSAGGQSSSDDEDGGGVGRTPNSTDAMVKKLVRLALASEYSRQPIRRSDIGTKVLGEHGSRPFKTVFEEAQKALRTRFGMEMVELPQREKVTVSQRRAAQRVEKSSASSNKSWILCSVLQQAYRAPEIVPPTKTSSSATEASYTALYTFIVAVIMLNGGSLAEQKLERYLRRMNADSYTPIDRTDRLLQRLCKEGYIVRNRDMDGGEEVIEYMVGPRGKTEVGARGVGDLAREVYGHNRRRQTAPGDGEDAQGERAEEFESRLERSLGFRRREGAPEGNGEGQTDNGARGAQRGRRSRREADEEEGTGDEAVADGEEDGDE